MITIHDTALEKTINVIVISDEIFYIVIIQVFVSVMERADVDRIQVDEIEMVVIDLSEKTVDKVIRIYKKVEKEKLIVDETFSD